MLLKRMRNVLLWILLLLAMAVMLIITLIGILIEFVWYDNLYWLSDKVDEMWIPLLECDKWLSKEW